MPNKVVLLLLVTMFSLVEFGFLIWPTNDYGVVERFSGRVRMPLLLPKNPVVLRAGAAFLLVGSAILCFAIFAMM